MELLLLSLICSIVSAFVPLIVRITLNWIYKVSKEEIILQNDAISLKKEMDAISMVDEFSKYAKLQRRLNKIKDELKQKGTTRLSTLMKNKLIFTWIFQIITGGILLSIVWFYRSVPVIVFPEERLWPIARVVSWPTDVPGGVSIAVWIVMTNRVARKAAGFITCRVFSENRSDGKKSDSSPVDSEEPSGSFEPSDDERE
ncbi:guided entry of tail-anchored proteins factor 1-like [Hetaerina americana]|uniref:guided entry of tail-anchored proteins factor 1-like n=1 Tax=Hetaerina americana TaxID=62018 RepID=UPI003A7F477D